MDRRSSRIARVCVAAGALTISVCSVGACGSDSNRAGGTSDAPARRDLGGTYVADYIETQGGALTLDRDAERATLLTRTRQESSRGEAADHDLRFLLERVTPGKPAAFEISTAGFTALDCGDAVLRTRDGRAAGYRLLIYKNPRRVKLLHQSIFRSGQAPHPIRVPLDGAVDVWLVWKALDGRAQPSSEFIMKAPRLLGGS